MGATLFSVPASHPSLAAMLMLDHKAIEYRRIDFVPPLHRLALRAIGFRAGTVPALRIDGRRVQGSHNISRALDAIRPQPPLFPGDPQRREAVERLEEWGDEVLQPVVRRIAWAALKRDRSIAEGLIGDPARNAADFQIATSLRALETMDDLQPLVAHRLAARFAHEVVPTFPGRIGPTLPSDWLPEPTRPPVGDGR